MMIKIHGLPTSNIPLPPPSIHPSIHPSTPHTLSDAEAISQQSQPSLPAKLIWQVCIKAPDQYPLRAVRAKAKKNNAAASPPLCLYQMRKNESWTLFSPLLNRSAVLSPALYQTDTHTNKHSHRHVKAHKWTQTHIYKHTHMQLQASLSPGWPPAIDRQPLSWQRAWEVCMCLSMCVCFGTFTGHLTRVRSTIQPW